MQRFSTIILASMLILGLVAAGFYWNEARKEVVFLCGNFDAGTTEASVIRQLETGNLLRYRQEAEPPGTRIVVDSAYSLGMHTCTITLDEHGTVVEALIS